MFSDSSSDFLQSEPFSTQFFKEKLKSLKDKKETKNLHKLSTDISESEMQDFTLE